MMKDIHSLVALIEPSMTLGGGRFYMTMRNDDPGYVSVSEDGLNFDEPRSDNRAWVTKLKRVNPHRDAGKP